MLLTLLPLDVTYVGAPIQFNFGDAGATRGVVVYDGVADDWEFVANPFGFQYYKVSEEAARKMLLEATNSVRGSYFTVVYRSTLSASAHETLKKELLTAGANAVFKQCDVVTSMRSSGEQLAEKLGKQQSLEDQIRLYAEAIRDTFLARSKVAVGSKKRVRGPVGAQKFDNFLISPDSFATLVDEGFAIAREAKPSATTTSGATFDGRLATVLLENFMGVRGALSIPFKDLPRGIWLIDGENGAGKSTIFEAVVWCQFGEFLRSGMQKDYAINDQEESCTVRGQLSQRICS